MFKNNCRTILSKSDPTDQDVALIQLVANWIVSLHGAAEEAFSVGVFLSNHAMLQRTVDATYALAARVIYGSSGTLISRPVKTLSGTIIISTLIGLQILGLVYVIWYIYQVPTWTHAFDAAAVARIGASIENEVLPAIGVSNGAGVGKLKYIDGLIGVVEKEGSDATNFSPAFRLGLGAAGFITRKHAQKK